MQIIFLDGTAVPVTRSGLVAGFLQKGVIGPILAGYVLATAIGPHPDLTGLPLVTAIGVWGLVLVGLVAAYLLTLILLGALIGRVYSVLALLAVALSATVLVPGLAGLAGQGPLTEARQGSLFVVALSMAAALEFVIISYCIPQSLRRAVSLFGPGLTENFADTGTGGRFVPPPAPLAPPARQVTLLGRRFALDDLRLISAEEHYVHIRTGTGRYMLRGRIADVEAQLGDAWGLRVHRSHWVAAQAVQSLRRGRAGWRLILTSGQSVPVARARRAAVAAWVAGLTAR